MRIRQENEEYQWRKEQAQIAAQSLAEEMRHQGVNLQWQVADQMQAKREANQLRLELIRQENLQHRRRRDEVAAAASWAGEQQRRNAVLEQQRMEQIKAAQAEQRIQAHEQQLRQNAEAKSHTEHAKDRVRQAAARRVKAARDEEWDMQKTRLRQHQVRARARDARRKQNIDAESRLKETRRSVCQAYLEGRRAARQQEEGICTLFVQPFMTQFSIYQGIYYCSNWTTPANTHDMSLLSGIVCATAIGADYPFQVCRNLVREF